MYTCVYIYIYICVRVSILQVRKRTCSHATGTCSDTKTPVGRVPEVRRQRVTQTPQRPPRWRPSA